MTTILPMMITPFSRWRYRLAHAGVRVLYYHGVVERKMDVRLERNFHLVEDFRRHLQLCRAHVISLEELAHRLHDAQPVRTKSLVITFDDGYANNQLAAELLAEYRLPWTVFVSVGAIEEHGCIWTMELSLLRLHGQAAMVEVYGKRWSLRTREERLNAYQQIRCMMKAQPADQRRDTLAALRVQFPPEETRRLLADYPSCGMLSWDGVRQLCAAGVEVGSHGVLHEIHHPQQQAAICQEEIMCSKQVLDRRLNRTCRYFAFPNGNYNEYSHALLREAGYAMALTTESRLITNGGEDPYLIPRIDPPARLQRFVSVLA